MYMSVIFICICLTLIILSINLLMEYRGLCGGLFNSALIIIIIGVCLMMVSEIVNLIGGTL